MCKIDFLALQQKRKENVKCQNVNVSLIGFSSINWISNCIIRMTKSPIPEVYCVFFAIVQSSEYIQPSNICHACRLTKIFHLYFSRSSDIQFDIHAYNPTSFLLRWKYFQGFDNRIWISDEVSIKFLLHIKT